MIALPLRWRRRTLAVLLWPAGSSKPSAVVADALVAGPFFIVRGSPHSLESRGAFTLFHAPSQTAQYTFPRQADCREAAAELAALDLAWESADPTLVRGPDLARAAEVHRKWAARAEELRGPRRRSLQ